MQRNVTALALIIGLQSPFAGAANHSDEILDACPNLKDGAVPTEIMLSDLSFDTRHYNSITLMNGVIADENTTLTRDNILFTNQDTPDVAKNLLMINSTGGSAYSSKMVIDAMNHTNNTITVCANEASSAALDILASGTHRYAMENCHAISHSMRGGTSNMSADDLINHAKEIKRLDDDNRKVLTNELLSDQCYSAIRSTKNGDTVLYSDDLLSLGLIDAILMPNHKMKVRADDPRINYQSCYITELTGKTLSEEQISRAYDTCYEQHMMP